MKLVISKQDLSQLIFKIQNIVPLKPTVPILSHVLIESANDELILTATDLVIGIRCFTEAKVLEEGSTTLPAKHFFQLIRELSNVPIEITTTTSGSTEIVAGPSSFKLSGMRKEEFPELPDLKDATHIKIDPKALKEALYRTSFATSKEDTRYALTGVYMEIANKMITFVGTDGKRLAKATAPIVADESLQRTLVLPFKLVEELQKIDDETEETTLFLMNDKIAAETSKSIIVSKLLTGEYPDFQRVIPKKTDIQLSLHREELISLLRQVILFTTETHCSARFSFVEGELIMSANCVEVGESKVSMPVNYNGQPLHIAFNPNFFLDILKHSRDETVNLGLIDSYNPGVITDSSNALFVIMPMRLQEV
ncbi:MAG: DNA polymerase III subunit beta [Chlamydiales bacterium]|nr:DNA polymerase III subunit beta [Chlamydiales bacterium]